MSAAVLAFAEPTVACLEEKAGTGAARIRGERAKSDGTIASLGNGRPSRYRPALWPGRLMALGVTGAIILGIAAMAIYGWSRAARSYPPDKTIVVTLLPNSAERPVARPERETPPPATVLSEKVEPARPAAEPQSQHPSPVSEPLPEQIRPLDSARPDPLGAITHAYQRAILDRINAQRRYPRGALLDGFEGNGAIRFTIERDGRLVEVSIATSTGRKALDRATLDLVRRSVPFPPIPAELPDQLEVTMPVRFLILPTVSTP